MNGLMMDSPLTLESIFNRAGRLFGSRPIVWRRQDKCVARHTYRQFHARTQQFANALSRMGLAPGTRVATPAWDPRRPPPADLAGAPAGLVLHTNHPRRAPPDPAASRHEA